MTYTADSPFISSPRITLDTFRHVMESIGSPWSGFASPLYQRIKRTGHDPAVWLAIGIREHRLLTDPKAVALRLNTNSWTNARSVRLPMLPHSIVTTDDLRDAGITNRAGPYVRYQNVEDSLRDGMFRVTDPKYVYVQRFGTNPTIGQVLSVWTESEAVEYTAFVVDSLNEWTDNVAAEFEWHECLIPEGRKNRPQIALSPDWITVHETANTNRGADAASHCQYIRSDAAANRPASWHVTVDDHSAYQHLPYNEVAWHAGDGATGTGNRHSLSIELCVNSDGDWDRTMQNAARIVRGWMERFAIPIDRVVQHHHWNKNTACPLRMRRGDWDGFVAMLRADTPPVDEHWEINGYILRGEILSAYRALGDQAWWTFGVPVEPDYPGVPVDGEPRTVQRFDRAGWVMVEDGQAMIAKPEQAKQIDRYLGVDIGHDIRLPALREHLRVASDAIAAAIGEVAD